MLDTTEFLLQLQNEAHGGPSEWGMSRYKALRSQAKAILEHGDAYQPKTYDASILPLQLSYLHVGIYGHKLFESRLKGALSDGSDMVWDARTEAFNPHFREAVRMYRHFHETWGSLENYLGCRVIGSEVALGSSEAVQPRILTDLGGKLTGRADAIVEIVDPDKCYANTGLHVMPGRWIIDYKFGRKHDKRDATQYTRGPQATNYLYLDAVEQGAENSALGMLFLRMVADFNVAERDRYAVYMALPDADAVETLREIVTQGQADLAIVQEWERTHQPTEAEAA